MRDWLRETDHPYFLHMLRTPRGVLHDALRHAWLVRADRCRMAVERVFPDDAIELYLNFGAEGRHRFDGAARSRLAQRRAWVVGPHTESNLIAKETRDCDIVGVRIRPHAASQLLGVPAGRLAGALVDLDELLSPAVVDTIWQRVAVCGTAHGRLDALEQVLRERMLAARHGSTAARCLAEALRTQRPVATIASELGVTHRRLIALSREQLGMTPKEFQRVRRLRGLLRVIDQPTRSWASVATACGYYDQAHLINDFRQQTGMSLREYVATRSAVSRGVAPHRLAESRA